MKNIKFYNIFIFISTLTRNIIDIYSVVYLYQKGILIKEIILIYAFVYLFGAIISTFGIKLGNKIGYKYPLIISSIASSVAFYLIYSTKNIYLISIFLSLSIFTYHPIRHYYGITLLKDKKNIGTTLIFIIIAQIVSSYFAIKKIKIIYLIIISIISIIPMLFIKKEKSKKITIPQKIPSIKLRFFILDQFKIIFLLLEPLYLYLVSKKLSYVGIFNIVTIISSIICLYVLSRLVNLKKYYKYINIIFVIVLILKLNIDNKTFLLIIAFLEGLGIKTNELVSTVNLYDNQDNNEGYVIISEIIFCITRSIILIILYLFNINLKISMYILLIGIFFLSFQYKNTSLNESNKRELKNS